MILTFALTLILQDPAPAAQQGTWATFQAVAQETHGESGSRAAAFLSEHRPPRDETVDLELLTENLALALETRTRFPWAKGVSDELFLNDVLPYAVLDETREAWRAQMLEIAAPLVADCATLGEAAQALNRGLFDAVNVHYNTGRKRPNASPSESIAQERATCTGLTILLVDACRAVGIPARAAGVYRWHDDRGNHTWAEIWDGERWRFTGADEYDPKGFDRAWFTADAAKATAGEVEHAVWASSWKTTGQHFPLVWAKGDTTVAAVEVTERYLVQDAQGALAALGGDGGFLGEEAAQRVALEAWTERAKALSAELSSEDEANAFTLDGKSLRIKEKRFGDAPEGARSLWISMHGGGGAPAAVNDRQWNNQIGLYRPAEGFYVAPRAPTDTWNLWHEGHIDPLFQRMITSYVTRHGVDPNRVYLLGYSAGGDGVYQLAPRMADRFAAASMMAGHPNDARPDGLRNLPFMIFMGGKDSAYKRNEVAAEWGKKLDALREADPEGYEHEVTIYPDKGHWMDGEDKSALPWMAERRRAAWPSKVVWVQDDVTHRRFYWLGVPDGADAKPGARVEASVDGQSITVLSEGAPGVELWLRDALIDLDREVTVTLNGDVVFKGEVPRTRAAAEASIAQRPDPGMLATARLTLGN